MVAETMRMTAADGRPVVNPATPVSDSAPQDAAAHQSRKALPEEDTRIAMSSVSARAASPVVRTVRKASDENFQQLVLDAQEPVIVDFYADWCKPCRALSPLLDEVAREKQGVRVVKVNVDDAPRLARQYRVRSLPTVIIFKEGNPVAQHVGPSDIRRALGY